MPLGPIGRHRIGCAQTHLHLRPIRPSSCTTQAFLPWGPIDSRVDRFRLITLEIPARGRCPAHMHRCARSLGQLLIAPVFALLIAWSWQRWMEPVIDFGRELYVPWQVSQGRIGWGADLITCYGPLSHLFNGFIFWLLARVCRHWSGRTSSS